MSRDAPRRTCLVCRRRRPKRELVRIVRSPSRAVSVDVMGSAPGRGAYVCADDPSCREGVSKRGAVGRALGVALSPDDLLRLAAELKEKSQA